MRELSLNVMDVAQNSITAKATLIELSVVEDLGKDELSIEIIDNGGGMTCEQVKNVTDPFFTTRTTRNVGLGIPLFKMQAEMTGGSFEIYSEKGTGTRLKAVFKPSSVDMTPLGDINATVELLITCNPKIDFVFSRSKAKPGDEDKAFSLNTKELKDALGDDVPLNTPDVVMWIKEFLAENTLMLQ